MWRGVNRISGARCNRRVTNWNSKATWRLPSATQNSEIKGAVLEFFYAAPPTPLFVAGTGSLPRIPEYAVNPGAIPAQAEIQVIINTPTKWGNARSPVLSATQNCMTSWIPACAGMTGRQRESGQVQITLSLPASRVTKTGYRNSGSSLEVNMRGLNRPAKWNGVK